MKKMYCLAWIVLSLGWSVFGQADKTEKINYYRVEIVGQALVTPLNPNSAVPDNRSGLVACNVRTELHLDYWFTMEGEYKYQKCTIQFKSIDCPAYGSADTCQWTPKPEAWTPLQFKTEAELKKDSATIDKLVHDQIQIHFPQSVPAHPIGFTVLCPGGTPGDVSDYGTISNQVFQILSKDVSLFPVFLGATEKTSSDDVLFGLYKVHIDFSVHQSRQGVADIKD